MRLKSVRYPDSGAEPDSQLVHYRYGDEGSRDEMISRVKTIHDDGTGESTGLPGQTLADYAYNGLGHLAVEEFPQPDVKLDYFHGTTGTYAGFDRFGRVKDQKWIKSTTVKDRYGYGHDYNSNRLWRQNELTHGTANKFDELYTYDGLDHLTAADRGTLDDPPAEGLLAGTTSFRQAWGLDPVGNWDTFKWDSNGSDPWDATQNRAHSDANEIETIDVWVNPDHDARGNVTIAPRPGDETSQLDFTYDAWNRLVKVVDNATSNVLGEYRYDGLNRRIRKYTEPADSNWTVREYYYNTGWQVLEIRKDVRSRASEPLVATTLYEQYVWSARYIDAPVLRDRDSSETPDGVLDERLYYANDANMNVTAVVEEVEEDDWQVVERYTYDPYGKVTVLNPDWSADGAEDDYANEILYCGYRHDPESNLYHVRNRYYHPTLGRFLQRDPLGYADGMSLYEYVRSGPLQGRDALGLMVALKCSKRGLKTLDKYLTNKGVKHAYQKKTGGGWRLLSDTGKITREGRTDLDSEILLTMIKSARTFRVTDGTLANLDKHIEARKKVVHWADRTSFGWGLMGMGNAANALYRNRSQRDDKAQARKEQELSKKAARKAAEFWANVKKGYNTNSDYDAIVAMMNRPKEHQMACYMATLSVYMRAAADMMDGDTPGEVAIARESFNKMVSRGERSHNIEGTRIYDPSLYSYQLDVPAGMFTGRKDDEKEDWIPGDWGYITKENPIYAGTEGENLIYLGNQKWWGHTSKGAKKKPLDYWLAKVKDWPGGKASYSGHRRYPKAGLDDTR